MHVSYAQMLLLFGIYIHKAIKVCTALFFFSSFLSMHWSTIREGYLHVHTNIFPVYPDIEGLNVLTTKFCYYSSILM